jgi:hypothetical protein
VPLQPHEKLSTFLRYSFLPPPFTIAIGGYSSYFEDWDGTHKTSAAEGGIYPGKPLITVYVRLTGPSKMVGAH